ncbi:amidohydrolase family protein [Mesorhizobium sp. B4-1-4]|uniref:amidohydrolase family protein n=1 Tax=Mesorhizobium sp. B4-1-4 TaxID=2589888 RepID=UPI001D014899|nr:amidohydrolase family protein [Mesorhizobium sp. B4-1-4]UCI31761.1 amidohydrolase family protein [Mesorhizobium sp. B4-1-4]
MAETILPKDAIDAHAHVFTAGLLPRQPAYASTADELFSLAEEAGSRRIVLTQPSFFGFDNGEVLAAAERYPDRVRATVWLPPETSRPELETLKARGVAGLRLPYFYTDLPDWEMFAEMLGVAGRLGLHAELGIPARYVAASLEQLLGFGINIVVEHMGIARSPDDPTSSPDFQALLSAADTGRVWVKLSASSRLPIEQSDWVFAQLLAAFGPKRLVWGSDWPRVSARLHRQMSYADCSRWLVERVLDKETLTDIAVRTPASLYGFDDQ